MSVRFTLTLREEIGVLNERIKHFNEHHTSARYVGRDLDKELQDFEAKTMKLENQVSDAEEEIERAKRRVEKAKAEKKAHDKFILPFTTKVDEFVIKEKSKEMAEELINVAKEELVCAFKY